ncbi:MAG: 50S ribosomal protein L6 [Candidatus Eisenbacteria bacterium]|nr:50S ribosomal protein L6 [Candidatus Eisenbacteria bacterium]
MSRVGKKIIELPKGVSVKCEGRRVSVTGPKGELSYDLLPGLSISTEESTVRVIQSDEGKNASAFHGLTRTLVFNMVSGVVQGFSKTLEIHGTGYRAQMDGKKLVLQIGFSHPVVFDPPEGIEISLDSPTRIVVKGIDKALVGEVAAEIRAVRKPEPYRGKGIRYVGEYVRKKPVKGAAGTGAKA